MSSPQDMEEVPSRVPDALLLEKLFKEQLIEACQEGDVDTVRCLVPDKVDINTQHDGYDRMTSLHVACVFTQLSVVEALLELKAEVNIKDDTGLTPLYTACVFRHLDLVRVLLAHGADVNVVGYQGRTALHMACKNGDHNILKALLSADGSLDGAPVVNVNRKDQIGNTPLYYACVNGNIDNAKLLFSRGAEVRDKEEQKKLLRAAREVGHVEMVKYLCEHYSGLK